jgi:glucose-6-phosphate isomerase
MLQLDNSKLQIKSFSSLKKKLDRIKKQELPSFERYHEDLNKLHQTIRKYGKYKNLILIGNGGSNTSFGAFYHALVPLEAKNKVFILTTMEPDLLKELKLLFPKKNTLVMPVSKSGTTIGNLESLFALPEYKVLPITSPNEGALSAIADKEKYDIIPHPEIGGRFSGLTASAFAPAMFLGIDVVDIDEGARAMYTYCNHLVPIENNPALQLAASLYLLEKKGYSEVFCPIYSSKLVGFSNLIVQLMHESVCKKHTGQTFYCADAPEAQHHTNQRFFGGQKNVVGLFITADQHDTESKVKVPDVAEHIPVRNGTIGDIDDVPYAKALEYEFQGTFRDAIANKIPVGWIHLDKITPFSVGEFLGFWHYVAVYSALLRDVNPYDQPHVETSKNLSFKLRKEHQ